MKLSRIKKSYIAGFLDGDGSIYVRIKPNKTYRYRFQISPAVVFYQSEKAEKFLQSLQKEINEGYIRKRNDGIVEFILGDVASIKELLNNIIPYLQLKKKQAKLLLEILEVKQKVKTANDFLRLTKKIDLFQGLNYSKKRIQNSLEVEKALKREKLIAP
jgi:hypothetical protein